jgi:hypothetical protein
MPVDRAQAANEELRTEQRKIEGRSLAVFTKRARDNLFSSNRNGGMRLAGSCLRGLVSM